MTDAVRKQIDYFGFCFENDVSTLDERADIAAAVIDKHSNEVPHRKLVFSSHVDPAQQSDVGVG